jgi:hypothetical protein
MAMSAWHDLCCLPACLPACLLIVTAACSSAPSPDEQASAALRDCIKLRQHVVDVRLADVAGLDDVARKAQQQAMLQALGPASADVADGYVAQCQKSMTSKQVACMLNAENTTAISACAPTTTAPASTE